MLKHPFFRISLTGGALWVGWFWVIAASFSLGFFAGFMAA